MSCLVLSFNFYDRTFEQSSLIQPILQRHVPGFKQYPFWRLQLELQIAGMWKANQLKLERSPSISWWKSHPVHTEILSIQEDIGIRVVLCKFRACSPARPDNLDRFFPSIQCDTLAEFCIRFLIKFKLLLSSSKEFSLLSVHKLCHFILNDHRHWASFYARSAVTKFVNKPFSHLPCTPQQSRNIHATSDSLPYKLLFKQARN